MAGRDVVHLHAECFDDLERAYSIALEYLRAIGSLPRTTPEVALAQQGLAELDLLVAGFAVFQFGEANDGTESPAPQGE